MGIGIVEPLAVEHDVGAMALGLGDLDVGVDTGMTIVTGMPSRRP